MPSTSKLAIRVSLAADEIFAGGKRPTLRSVRDRLGGGSYRDIGPLLKAWKPTAQVPPSSGGEDGMVPREMMDAEIARVQDELDGARRHLMIETDRLRQELGGPLRSQVDSLLAKNANLESELELLRARLAAAERQIR